MPFSQARNAISHLLPKIVEHPFNIGLRRGTLPQILFAKFLEQDALYLRDFSIVLNKIAGRVLLEKQKEEYVEKLSAFLTTCAEDVENEIPKIKQGVYHRPQTLFSPIKLVRKNQATSTYTEHLHDAVNQRSIEEAIASVLPCFWLYHHLGEHMLSADDYEEQDNPYKVWVELYSDKSFAESVKSMVKFFDELGSVASPALQQAMIEMCVQSTKHEIALWNSIVNSEAAEQPTQILRFPS